MVQEGAGFDIEQNQLAVTGNIQPVQRTDGAFRLTGNRSERREIMLAEQNLRGGVHGRHIKRMTHMPHPVGFDTGAGRAVQKSVPITATNGREAGAPCWVHRSRCQNHDWMVFEMVGKAVSHSPGIERQGDWKIQMRHLSRGMNACIRTSGGDAGNLASSRQPGGSFFQQLLNG